MRAAAAAFAAAIVVLATACASSYRMGDPLKAAPATKTHEAPAPQSARQNAQAKAKVDPWDEKWRLIQGPSDSVTWVDHFRVCAIKYRYRNYEELFHCLDLFETKLANGGKSIAHDLYQASGVERFPDVTIGLFAHRPQHLLRRVIASKHHHFGLNRLLAQASHQLQAVQAWHPDI